MIPNDESGSPAASETAPAITAETAEAWVIETEEGARLLVAIDALSRVGPAEVGRLRAFAPPEMVRAALRLSEARRRGARKFRLSPRMWLDPVGVEQATSELVARHKSARFAGRRVVDLCAGVGGDGLAIAGIAEVIAVDRDRLMCRRLRHNAALHGVADRLLVVQAQAARFAIPAGAWVHLDPDRRAGVKGRARAFADYAPGPEVCQTIMAQADGGLLKLGPASDFAKYFGGDEYEIELVSLDGECKEAIVWFGEAVSCRRRATCLPSGATWTDRDSPVGSRCQVSGLQAFVHDPDPALSRSGLLSGFATAHGLSRLDETVDYLTSDSAPETPFLTSFEVVEHVPFDLKQTRTMLSRHDAMAREIKVRGVDVTPEVLRVRLRGSGTRPATLIVSRVGGRARVILAHRASTAGSTRSSEGSEVRESIVVESGKPGSSA